MARLISRAWVAVLLFLTAVLLLIAAAPLAGFRATVLTGGSMEPEYRAGGMVLVDKVAPSTIGVEDVITYTNQSGGLTTHRVISVESAEGELAFRTKGDANPTPDVDLTPGPLIIGKVVADISWAAPLLTTVTGSRARVLVPGVLAMWLAIAEVRDLRRWRHDADDMVEGEEAADLEPLEPVAAVRAPLEADAEERPLVPPGLPPQSGPLGMVRVATIAPPARPPRVPPPGPPPTTPAAAPTTAAPAAVNAVFGPDGQTAGPTSHPTPAAAQPAAQTAPSPGSAQPAVPAGGEATPPGYVPVVVWMQWPPQLVWPEQQRGLGLHDTPGGTTDVPESVPSWLTQQVADDVAAEEALHRAPQPDNAGDAGQAPVARSDRPAQVAPEHPAVGLLDELAPSARSAPHQVGEPGQDGRVAPLAERGVELRSAPPASPPSLQPPRLQPPATPPRPAPPSTPPPTAPRPSAAPMPVAAPPDPAWLRVDAQLVSPPPPDAPRLAGSPSGGPSWLEVPARRVPPDAPPPVGAVEDGVTGSSARPAWAERGIVGVLMRTLVVLALVLAGIGGGTTLTSGALLSSSVPVDVAAISTLVLATPGGVAAVRGCSGITHKITVSWTDGSGEDGYDILRRRGTNPFAVVAHVGANAVQYIDSGLLANTTYEYKVRATRASWVSADGGPTSATTQVVCV